MQNVSFRPAPPASSVEVRRRMQAVRRRDTAPELAVRAVLRSRKVRYRVDYAPLEDRRRRADIAFTPARVAVYIDGCFWHGCPVHGRRPKTNGDWWSTKLARNKRRDRDTDRRLARAGWLVVRVWEHDDPLDAAERILEVVARRRVEFGR